MSLEDQSRPRRAADHSNQDARRAVTDVIERFTPWRFALAQMSGRIERNRMTPVDREKMALQCAEIERGIVDARTDRLVQLMDAPAKVAGNSRVVDIERALDNLEAALIVVRQKLERAH